MSIVERRPQRYLPCMLVERCVTRTPRRVDPGFTFIEILFAIIILGVGMIMIAGMLPVAIKQTSDTRDEVVGQAVCDAGYANLLTALQTSDTDVVFPSRVDKAGDAYGMVNSLDFETVSDNTTSTTRIQLPDGTASTETVGDKWRPVAPLFNSRTSVTDPRFRWLSFYRRDPGSGYVKLIIVALRNHNTDSVADPALNTPEKVAARVLQREAVDAGNGPFRVNVSVIEGDDPPNNVLAPDRIEFLNRGSNSWDRAVAVTGAYVIIRQSQGDNDDPTRVGRNNGRIFRLANQRLDLDPQGRTWDLATGYDLVPLQAGPDTIMGTADDLPDRSMQQGGTYTYGSKTNIQGKAAEAYILGRGRADPTAAVDETTSFSGPAQETSVLQVNVLVQ